MLAAAGCAENPADTSSGTEGSESSSGAESSDPNPFVEPEVNEIRDTINALYGNAPDRSLRANNMLSGKLPELSRPISTEYPGNGGRALTDGVRVQSFDSQAWVGFNGRDPVTLTFDLGEVVDGLADFEVGAFKSEGYGIGPVSYTHLDVYKRQVSISNWPLTPDPARHSSSISSQPTISSIPLCVSSLNVPLANA